MARSYSPPFPLKTRSEETRLINASLAVGNSRYGDKWEDIVNYVNAHGLTSETARALWLEMKIDFAGHGKHT
jgi:hypothetical protein